MADLKCNSCSGPDNFVFRKVVIPAVMGDDSEGSDYAPENGLYKNALVVYQANGAMYLYSSDGIYTKLTIKEGIKLYEKYGLNTDAPMTQKATTEMVFDYDGTSVTRKVAINGDGMSLTAVQIGGDASADMGLGTAVGYQAKAATNASAYGSLANANKNGSTAIGYVSRAEGLRGTAVGHSSRADGEDSVCIGKNGSAYAKNSVRIGTDGVINPDSQDAIQIGNGGSCGNSPKSIQIGAVNYASSAESSVSIGYSASVSSKNAVVIGNNARSSSVGGVAIGDTAIVEPNANNSVSIGSGAKVGYNYTNSVAIGSGSVALESNIVAFGNRRLTGVADGIADTDAATVAQINALQAQIDELRRLINA